MALKVTKLNAGKEEHGQFYTLNTVRIVWVNSVKVLQKLRQEQPIVGITAAQFMSKFSHRNYSHNDAPSVPRR